VLERISNPHVTIFKRWSLNEKMLEINYGAFDNREDKEARKYEEIGLREETGVESIKEE
jgi:hypothetical protein